MGMLNCREYWIKARMSPMGIAFRATMMHPGHGNGHVADIVDEGHQREQETGDELRAPARLVELFIAALNFSIDLRSRPNALTML